MDGEGYLYLFETFAVELLSMSREFLEEFDRCTSKPRPDVAVLLHREEAGDETFQVLTFVDCCPTIGTHTASTQQSS